MRTITVTGARLFLAPLLVLCGIAAAYAKPPLSVIAARAELKPLFDRVEVLGTLRANETVELTAAVTDTVTAIHFNDGQMVAAGDILVEMTSAEEHAQLEEELSRRDEARKQYERVVPLVDRGAASRALLDQRQRELATAEARLLAIESRLQDRLITAPFGGVVGLRNISLGALVEPGDIITTLDDVSVMKLDFQVPSIHLASLQTGTPIQAGSPAFPGRQFTGTISSIDSRINPVTRSIAVRALLDNGDGLLKPGLMMTVTLLKNRREALIIPEEALIPRGEENSVLRLDESSSPPVARSQSVAIGTRRLGEVEIIQGLQAGDLVITHGIQRLRPGQEVTVLSVDAGDEPLNRLLSGDLSGTTP